MEIVGLGSDMVECARIGRMIKEHGEMFLGRVFSEREMMFCQRRTRALEYFAAIWTVKEAVLKSLGYSGQEIPRTMVEVIIENDPRPQVQLHGGAKALARTAAAGSFLVTMAHCRTHASATVIAVKSRKFNKPAG